MGWGMRNECHTCVVGWVRRRCAGQSSASTPSKSEEGNNCTYFVNLLPLNRVHLIAGAFPISPSASFFTYTGPTPPTVILAGNILSRSPPRLCSQALCRLR